MKKIISKGHKFMQTQCTYCSCVFQFEEEDIEARKEIRDNHGCPCATDWKLTCPDCQKEFWVRDTCNVKKIG